MNLESLEGGGLIDMNVLYEVRWYDYNLTNERSRKFFTRTGALLFHIWLYYRWNEPSRVYEI